MINENNTDKGFLISASWLPALELIDTGEYGKIIPALMNYQLSGGKTRPELESMSPAGKMFCLCVMPQIDKRIEGALNGRKGGRPKKTSKEN